MSKKKAKTYVVINQKGGVGKTTTAINLMAGLSLIGKKVLGIDLDPQGQFSTFIGVDTTDKNTILELMKGTATFKETIATTKYGDILPADSALQTYLMELTVDVNGPFIIKEFLDKEADNYDYVIIDCPPAVNQFTISALVVADKVIIPTEAEYFSVDGVKMIVDTIEAVKKRLNPNLKVEGLLLVKYQQRRGITKDVEEFLEKIAKNLLNSKLFDSRIRATVDIPTSQGFKKSIFEYNVNSNASKDYANLVKEIIGVDKNE